MKKVRTSDEIREFLEALDPKKDAAPSAEDKGAAAGHDNLKGDQGGGFIDGVMGRGKRIATKIGDVFTAARRFNKAYDAIADVAKTIHDHSGPVGPVVAWTGRTLASAFKFAAFERENGEFKRDKDGDLIFSKGRLGRHFAGAAGVALAASIAVQGAYFYGTQFEETVYTTGKQEIQTGEQYQFSACKAPPCSTETDNGRFYLINRSLYFPHLVYPEEDVFANIPQQDGVCTIKGYGFYFKNLSFVHKYLNWYQNVYDVNCRPLALERDGTIPVPAKAVSSPVDVPVLAVH